MIRLGVRGRSVCFESLDKHLETLGSIRESSTIFKSSSEHTVAKQRLRCLIDSETRSNGTEGRRSSSTTSASTAPTPEPRKTCLYDLHVENRGNYQWKFISFLSSLCFLRNA